MDLWHVPQTIRFVRFVGDRVTVVEIAALGKPIEIHDKDEMGGYNTPEPTREVAMGTRRRMDRRRPVRRLRCSSLERPHRREVPTIKSNFRRTLPRVERPLRPRTAPAAFEQPGAGVAPTVEPWSCRLMGEPQA